MNSSDSGHDSGSTSSDEMADRGDSLHVSELSLPPSPVLQRESPVLLRFLSDTQTTSQLELVTRLENRSGNEIFPRDEGMPSFSNNTPDSEVVLNQVSDSVNNINEITREMRILLLEGFTILEHNNQSDIQAPETFCVNNEKQDSNKNCREPQMESPEEQSRVSQQQRDKILTYSNVAFQTDSSVLSQFKSEKLEENPSSFSPMKPAPPILSKTPICSEISSNAHSYQCSTSKSNSNSGGSNLTSPCAVATYMLTALPTSSDEMADRGDSLHVSELSLPPSPVLQRESPVLLRFLSDTQTTSQLELVTRLENRSGNEIFPRDEGMPSFSNNTPDSEVVLNQVSDSVNNINEITREMRILLLEGFTILEHNNQSDIQAPETFCVNNEKQDSN